MPEALSVGEVAAQFGLDPDTLRYYERIGVLPAPTRNSSGHRTYRDQDVHLIDVLLHLRDTGMPLTRIAEFTRLVASDPDGVPERLALLEEHQAEVLKRLRAWQNSLTLIEQKIADYRSRLEQ